MSALLRHGWELGHARGIQGALSAPLAPGDALAQDRARAHFAAWRAQRAPARLDPPSAAVVA